MKRLVTLACSLALFGACGSDGGASSGVNTTPATATTSTAAPQSTVAVATVPTSSAPIAVATVAPTSDATDHTTESTDDTDTSAARTTSTIAGVSTTDASSRVEYATVTAPVVPTETAAIRADNTHPDGVYYATVTEGGDPPPAVGSVVFELVQLFTGDACATHFGPEDQDSCVNDYGVETDPTSTIEVPLADEYITVADAATQASLRISGAELYGLLHGDDPSAGAPKDYLYSGFGFIVTVAGGEVTRLEQWWTP